MSSIGGVAGDDSDGFDDGDVEFAMRRYKPNIQGREETYDYEVLTSEQILVHMNECIEEVNTVLQMPYAVTRMLLNHFRWDKDKLMEMFYDGDQKKLFMEAHIVYPFAKAVATTPIIECLVCFLTIPIKDMSSLECGHRICNECWTEYITMKIMSEGIGQTLSCAAHNCDVLIDDSTIMRLVTDIEVRTKFQRIITNSFVESNRNLRWCPSPGCSKVIRVTDVELCSVTCPCGHIFCFSCGKDRHDPIPCHLLLKWIKKCDEDSATYKWIAENTKACPRCRVSIERNGGCNHMTCTSLLCRTEFCWICLGPWGTKWEFDPFVFTGHVCKRFSEDATHSNRSSKKAEFERFLFYRDRYLNHMQSLRLEHTLYEAIKGKMEKMQQHNKTRIEVKFLKKAMDVLCQCRQTLMYTYVFAYFLKKNHQLHIFEDNQRDLQSATEMLSEYLEQDITHENLADVKQKIQNKFQDCDRRRRAVMEHVREGNEMGWWECNE